jgi:hypothetical protein
MPSGGLGSTNSWREDASSMRSWTFYTKSLAWMQDVLVQGEPREGNDDWRERRSAADQPRGCAPTPPAHRPAHENNRRANEGVNINANTDADAPPLFRRASQNLAAAAMLLRGCPEPATSEERGVRQ